MADDLRFQLLHHRVHLSVDGDEALAAKLTYLANGADQAVVPTLEVEVEVEVDVDVVAADGIRVTEQGDELGSYPTAEGVLYVLYRRLYQRCGQMLTQAGWLSAHAATCTLPDGSRALMVGDAGAGKTTLSTRLLFDGIDVHGDERVLFRAGESMALPRRFHLKPGAEQMIAELGPIVAGLPFARTNTGEVIRGLDPAELGRRWTVSPAPADIVVILEPVHGSRSGLDPIPTTAAIEEFARRLHRAWEPSAVMVREMTQLVGRSRCYRLGLGDLAEAAALMVQLGT